ncbi:MAG: hlyD [Solimicrobium sp.]|jgi:HlyD family secretion protein|nr:hlyD [Solimicrobium sp.]
MRNKIIIALIVSVIVAIAVFFGYQQKNPSDKLILSGNVDVREVNLSFRVGGRLQKLRVDEGTRVKTGDVLGILDNQPYQIAFIEAKANQAALGARRALYGNGYRKEDIQQGKANLTARLVAQQNALQLLQRQKKLQGTGAISQRNFDEAQFNFDQAKAQVDIARQQYLALNAGFRKEEIAEIEANYERATAQVESAALQLADTVLLSPSDGIILTRAVEPGTMLNAGSNVYTLALTEPVWVRAYVTEPNLGQVAPGTQVKVYTDSRVEPYDAVIGFVSPTSEFTPKNVETADLRTALVYRLRIIVNRPDNQLLQGMPVTVKVNQP